MALFPSSLTALTPANAAFLEASLDALRRPGCVIQGAENSVCRQTAQLALREKIPVIDAASAIDRAHAWNQIRRLWNGVADERGRNVETLESVETYSLREAARRLGDRQGFFRRVMEASPGTGLDVTEIRLKPDAVGVFGPARRLMALNGYLKSGIAAEFYESVVHPGQSDVWRYLPLQVELGVLMMRGGERAIGVQLTSAESSFDELRDLLDQAEPRRPLCVPCPAFRGDAHDSGDSLRALEVIHVHATDMDAYRMARHDLSHISVFNQMPAQRPLEAVMQYDALEEAVAAVLDGAKEGSGLREVVDELRDHLLSGYVDPFESLVHVRKRLLGESMAIPPHASIAVGLVDFFQNNLDARIRRAFRASLSRRSGGPAFRRYQRSPRCGGA